MKEALRFVTHEELKALFWAHTSSPTQVFARLHGFPEGLPSGVRATRDKEALQAQELRATGRSAVSPKLDHLRVRVKRTGCSDPLWLPWTRVVEGDLVFFEAGDLVVADVRVLATGRDGVVVKPPVMLRERRDVYVLSAVTEPEGTDFLQARNMAWANSVVLRGSFRVWWCTRLVTPCASCLAARCPIRSGIHRFASRRAKSWQSSIIGRSALASSFRIVSRLSKGFARCVLPPLIFIGNLRCCSGRSSPPSPLCTPCRWARTWTRPCRAATKCFSATCIQCCSIASASSLNLEKIKEWNSGQISVGQVTAEGKRDPTGTSLLRFALSKLGAKEFWANRQAGFKVFSSPDGKMTLAQMANVGYFWCTPEEAKELCSSGHAKRRKQVERFFQLLGHSSNQDWRVSKHAHAHDGAWKTRWASGI